MTTKAATKSTAGPAGMIPGSVVSSDGTRIGYLRLGQGPAAVLLHGSSESARSHTGLAVALADAFTLYLPDRRGRGMSGPYGPGYGMRTELEDLDAVLAESGAQLLFGVSAGALVALEAARTRPAIRKVALYEPALLSGGTRYTSWLSRFDQEMASGDVAAALITSMHGLDLAPPAMKVMPRWLLAAITRMAMKSEDKKAAGDMVTMRKLAPTLRYDGMLLAEMAGTIGTFADVPAEVLLLGGSKNGRPSSGRRWTRLSRPCRAVGGWSSPVSTTAAPATSARSTRAASPRLSPGRSAASSPSHDRQPALVPAHRAVPGAAGAGRG